MDMNKPKGRVFVVQVPVRADSQGRLVPRFNLEPAKEHGELVFLLQPSAKPFTPEKVLPELREKLKDYNDDDKLLLTGSPALMGWVAAIAANNNEGRVTILQWTSTHEKYQLIQAGLWPDGFNH